MRVGSFRVAALAAWGVFSAGVPASADDQKPEQIVVTGSAHVSALSVDAGQIAALHASTIADALNDTVPSVFISDTVSNPFQLDVYFRGFDASPVLGSPEGLAIYQNGNRINEPFGDTVLWDLVPTFAIRRIDVVPGSDPVLGLNALGGAVALVMKTGFDMSGEQFDISGGSFGRATGVAEFARQYGDTAVYIGATAAHDGGWRRASPSDLGQIYADVSTRGLGWSAGTSLTLSADRLTENAAVPVQDSPRAAFSIPDKAQDRLIFLQSHGEYDWDSRLTLRGAMYFRSTQINTRNGKASGFVPCASDPSLLCAPGDPVNPLISTSGGTIASSLVGNGTIGVQTTATNGFGTTAEAEYEGAVVGLENTAIIGAAFDYATTRFDSSTELGILTYQPGGVTTIPDGIDLGGSDRTTRLHTVNSDFGLYAEDALDITSTFSARISGRFNLDRIGLTDRLGSALTGAHDYSGFNPAVRLTWRFTDDTNVYADFGQSSRTPTAAELGCANAARPCLFPLSFISDPGLHQVVARTVELGARGKTELGAVALDWLGDVYETRNSDDIIFVSTGNSFASGYFANAGVTERRGAEASLHAVWGKLDARASYSLVLATFQSAFTIHGAFNPGADPNGNIFVHPGDFMPNIPRHTAKLNVGYQATPALHLGLQAHAASYSYFRGDEANLQKPLPGYVIFDADVDYQIADGFTLYLTADNIFDKHYATFGLYGDPTGNGALPQFTNPRFTVPAAPTTVAGGIRAAL